MDGEITTNGFIDALLDGNILIIVGMSIFIVFGAIHYVLSGKFGSFWDKIFSILRGMASGSTPVLLMAGAAGLSWHVAVFGAVAGLLLSKGFLDLIRDAIPSKSS